MGSLAAREPFLPTLSKETMKLAKQTESGTSEGLFVQPVTCFVHSSLALRAARVCSSLQFNLLEIREAVGPRVHSELTWQVALRAQSTLPEASLW